MCPVHLQGPIASTGPVCTHDGCIYEGPTQGTGEGLALIRLLVSHMQPKCRNLLASSGVAPEGISMGRCV